MSATTASRWILQRYDVRCFVTVVIVAFVYFTTAKFGLLFAFPIVRVTAVWPPTGIAIAALALFGYRIWPAILIAAFAANITESDEVLMAAGIAVGNTLGPLAAAFMLRRTDFDPTLARVRDALALMVVGPLGMTLSALNGVANLALAHIVPWRAFFHVWWLWWLGDSMGVLVAAPLILSWAAAWELEFVGQRLFEFLLLAASMILSALIVLDGVILDDPHVMQYEYVLFLGVVWAAMRFGQRGASALVLVLVSFAVWGATHGRGPFIDTSVDKQLIELELFAGAISVTGLVLATVTFEREYARTSLLYAHDELSAAESRLRTVIANAPLVIWSLDMAGRYTFVDGAVMAKIGLTPHQLMGQHYTITGTKEHVVRAMEAVSEGESCQIIDEYEGHIFETHMEPLRNDRDQIAGVIGVSIDVTERVQAESEKQRLAERIQHAQKLESLGVLAGGIAHDFNNLLTAIVGNADLALMVCNDDDDEMREHIGQIQVAASRAADLTRQMLAYAGKGACKVVPLNLSQAVEEMARLLRASISKKAVLHYQFAGDIPLIEADPAQVSQVAMNLITNASDALGEHSGNITVSTGVMDVDASTLAACVFDEGVSPGRFVYLEVSDTGAGMEPAIATRMFDPFFTTKFAGRGLGLSAVRGIMRGHRGTLRVTSQIGLGTTVRALFPVGGRAPESEPAHSASNSSWRGQGTILVVDDEQSVREVSSVMLEVFGFSVLAAGDGERAMAVYQQSREHIRVVLLDMTMPVMNGEETFVALKRINPEVKVVLCSGYTEQDTTARFAGRGLSGFLQKPFVASDLISLMRRVLDE